MTGVHAVVQLALMAREQDSYVIEEENEWLE